MWLFKSRTMKRFSQVLVCLLLAALLYSAAQALIIPATVGISSPPASVPPSGTETSAATIAGNRKAVFYFSVSQITSGTSFTKATLRLSLPQAPNPDSSISVYKITGAWRTQGACFVPVLDSAPLVSVPAGEISSDRVLEIDVTPVVRGWANAPTGIEGFWVAGSFGGVGPNTAPLNFEGVTDFGLSASLVVDGNNTPTNARVDPYAQWPAALKSMQVNPVITVQPWLTASGSISVSAHGAGVLGYQWYRDGVAIAGATGAQLSPNGLQSGSYVVRVQNGYGTVSSGGFTFDAGASTKTLSGPLKTSSFANGVSMAIKQDGTLWAWGYNNGGQLGLGYSGDVVSAPRQVGTDTDWCSVVTDGGKAFGLKTNGTLWAWGGNGSGELGLGTSGGNMSTPTQVGSSGDWASVVTWGSTFAIKKDGTLWAWGNNWEGWLGLGTSDGNVSTPTQVGSSLDWASVVLGSARFGIKKDGTLWAWGSNAGGQLGLGTSGGNVSTPTQVGSSHEWASVVSAGATFGIKKDGTLWAWGYNTGGQLGLGYTSEAVCTPAQVGSSGGWASISSYGTTFGVKNDGTLWAWGAYSPGGEDLGLGTSGGPVSTPTQVGSSAGWANVVTTWGTTFGIKKDGTLWAWGNNANGELGLGTRGSTVSTPVQIGLDSAWSSVAPTVSWTTMNWMPGLGGVFAFRSDGSLWAWGPDNLTGALGTGSTENPLTVPTKIESTIPWKLPSSFQIRTNSPSPAGVLIPRIRTGSTLAMRIDSVPDAPIAAVDWYVNGSLLRRSSVAPWAATIQAPTLAVDEPSRRIALEARILDDRGNLIKTVRQEMDVVRDAISPVVTVAPTLAASSSGASVSLSFSKTLDYVSALGAFKVISAGTDGVMGSPDDFVVQGGTVSITDKTATVRFANALGAGTYRLVVAGSQLDTVGNPLGLNYKCDFVNTTSIWVGSASGLWTDPANWSGGVVPTAIANVQFPATSGSLVVLGSPSAVSVNSVDVQRETTLVGVNLTVAQNLSMAADLTFSGANTLRVGSIVENTSASGIRSRVKVRAGVSTGAGAGFPDQPPTTTGILRLLDGLTLTGDLEVETGGVEGTTRFEIDGALNLSGKTLRLYGGDGAEVKFGAGQGTTAFGLTGPGKIAFGWTESLLAEGSSHPDRLLTKVTIPRMNVPQGVELAVAGRGRVQLNAVDLLNSGTIRVESDGWLGATNYAAAEGTSREWVGPQGTFEKTVSRKAGQAMKSASFRGSNLAIKEDGTLWAWGSNWTGALGLGYTGNTVSTPTQVGSDTNWSAVDTDGGMAVGLKTDGTLWIWGYGRSAFSTRVGSDSDWARASVRGGVGLGIKTNGTLWAWGYNNQGQLGLGTTGDVVNEPAQVGGDTDWSQAVTDGSSAFALKRDGSLWAWGDGYSATSMQVGSSYDWDYIYSIPARAGLWFAIKKDGTLWAWGYNGDGRLGLGYAGDTVRTPTQVGTDSDWRSVSGFVFDGVYISALKTDNSLWVWGNNGAGQLGVGTTTNPVTAPMRVGAANDWQMVTVFGECAWFGIKRNGTLWAWGKNSQGQLGLGFTSDLVNMPTQVGTDSDWSFVDTWGDSFAMKQDGSLWAWAYNPNGGRPTKIESTVPWRIPSQSRTSIRINTNSPSPSNLPVPRIVSGAPLVMQATELNRTEVAAVEWLVNGASIGRATTSPWSASITAPTLSDTETSRRLSVDAYVLDPAGLLLDVVRQEIDVVRDATPPAVVGVPSLVTSGTGTTFQVSFSEALGGSLSPSVFRLIADGADGVFGTPDDVVLTGGTASFGDRTVTVSLDSEPVGGKYRLVLDRGIVDVAGNPLGEDYHWDFVTTSTWTGPALGAWTDPANWSNNTVPLGGARVVFPEGGDPRVIRGYGSTPVALDSLQISGDTTLVNMGLNVSGEVTLNADLAFSGENQLRAGSIVEHSSATGIRPRLKVKAGVEAVDEHLGSMSTTSGVLRLLNGLTLTDDLDVETASMGGATSLHVAGSLELGGKTLKVYGGYGGALSFTAAEGTNRFGVAGPGKIAFAWNEALLADGTLDSGRLLTKVSVPRLTLPQGAEWDVPSLGKVQVSAADFVNSGTIRVEAAGWLSATHYRTVGDKASEVVAATGALQKIPEEKGVKQATTVSFNYSNLAIKEDGTLWAWGSSNSTPTQVGTDSDWSAVSTDGNHSVGVKTDGTLWIWGYGLSSVPAQFGFDSDWSYAKCGSGSFFALKTDGSLWAWGNNYGGLLGVGSFLDPVVTPMRVGGDAKWEMIDFFVTEGGRVNLGIKTDRTLWAWGFNYEGQLGQGTTGQGMIIPTQVGVANDWIYAATDGRSVLATRADRSLWAWGSNHGGSLGVGAGSDVISTPMRVGTDNDWVAVSLVWGQKYGVKTDGTLWAWGYNEFNGGGLLGLGFSSSVVSVPTQVGNDTDWGCGSGSSAIKQDGSLWAWGYNWNGSLGAGSFENPVARPIKIESVVPWRTPSAIQIGTNSPSPSSLRIPRLSSGSPLVLTATPLGRVPIGSIEWFVNGRSIGNANASPWPAMTNVPALGNSERYRRLRVEAYVRNASGVLLDIVSREVDVVDDATSLTGE